MRACVHACMYVAVVVHTNMYSCVYVYVYVYIYIYIYIYIFTDTHTHTYIHTYVHTYIDTYIHTYTWRRVTTCSMQIKYIPVLIRTFSHSLVCMPLIYEHSHAPKDAQMLILQGACHDSLEPARVLRARHGYAYINANTHTHAQNDRNGKLFLITNGTVEGFVQEHAGDGPDGVHHLHPLGACVPGSSKADEARVPCVCIVGVDGVIGESQFRECLPCVCVKHVLAHAHGL
jgi:hypothetical protein